MKPKRNLSADEYQELLSKHSACALARKEAHGKTLRYVWRNCKRGDWLLWLAGEVGVERKLIVMAGCATVRPALKYIAKDETAPLIAIETAEAWCRAEATLDQVRIAAYAAADVAARAAVAARADSLRLRATIIRRIISVEDILDAIEREEATT